MRVRYLTGGFACISYLVLGIAGACQAQQQVPGQAENAQPQRQGRIMRSSQMIGLNIQGSDGRPLGIVKDFVVDCQGDCPQIYFAMEPDASLQLGQEYVILPYSAMRYDSRGGTDYFALDMVGSALRGAPRVAVNGWSTFNDQQVLGNVHQFYQRTERTAARPIQGGAARPDAGTSTPKAEVAPRLDPNTQPKIAPQPESAAHPETARPPKSGARPAAAPRPESSGKEPAEHEAPRR